MLRKINPYNLFDIHILVKGMQERAGDCLPQPKVKRTNR